MKSITSLTALILVSLSLNAIAVSLTEIQSNGHTARLYVDGNKGRMDGGDEGYMLVDSNTHKLYMVAEKHGQALDLSSYLDKAPARAGAKTSFKPAGNGPSIAGYATKHYIYSVGGQPCGSLYTSKQALADSGAQVLVQAMERLAARSRAINGDGGKGCGRGRDNIAKVIASLGMPMRISDNNGTVDSEVISINTQARLPASAFDLPAGIQVRDGAQIEAMANKYRPQIDSMMEQAEQSGQLSPQMMDKLRRAKARWMH